MTDYDWLIIGGGPHGRFSAASIQQAVPTARLAIVDPNPGLAAWHARANACGMRYLRSSGAHHLGPRGDSLRRFAADHGYDAAHTLGYYHRPSRALFEAHADAVLPNAERISQAAERIMLDSGAWHVRLADGQVVSAERVIVATGPGPVYRPPGLEAAEHVFDAGFERGDPANAPDAPMTIVGGGITGAQLALRAAGEGHRVRWITRTAPRAADFDSDPCYAGPRCLAPFAEHAHATRSRLLADARQPGTLPPDVYSAITAALAAGELGWQRGHAEALTDHGLWLADGRFVPAGRVILATGFVAEPSRDSVLGRLIADHALASDGAGHIVLNRNLEAAPGLHIVGRPASLELGPMAGNIQGARLAGRRLTAFAKDSAASRSTGWPATQSG